jgi:hypothetical protein
VHAAAQEQLQTIGARIFEASEQKRLDIRSEDFDSADRTATNIGALVQVCDWPCTLIPSTHTSRVLQERYMVLQEIDRGPLPEWNGELDQQMDGQGTSTEKESEGWRLFETPWTEAELKHGGGWYDSASLHWALPLLDAEAERPAGLPGGTDIWGGDQSSDPLSSKMRSWLASAGVYPLQEMGAEEHGEDLPLHSLVAEKEILAAFGGCVVRCMQSYDPMFRRGALEVVEESLNQLKLYIPHVVLFKLSVQMILQALCGAGDTAMVLPSAMHLLRTLLEGSEAPRAVQKWGAHNRHALFVCRTFR